MTEAIPCARRHQHETRGRPRKKGEGAAPVGAVMGRDESPAFGVRTGREESPLSVGLEISRQQNRSAAGAARAQCQATIVQRSAAILDARVKDQKVEAAPDRSVASLESSHGHTARDGIGRNDACDGIVLGALADP
jgi:hypothetical protein